MRLEIAAKFVQAVANLKLEVKRESSSLYIVIAMAMEYLHDLTRQSFEPFVLGIVTNKPTSIRSKHQIFQYHIKFPKKNMITPNEKKNKAIYFAYTNTFSQLISTVQFSLWKIRESDKFPMSEMIFFLQKCSN